MHSGNETLHEKGQPILESLYELWINQDPAYDEQVRQLYGKLGEWVNKMNTQEADRMTGISVDLCIAYSRKGGLDGARLGGLLIRELLLELRFKCWGGFYLPYESIGRQWRVLSFSVL